MNRGVCAARPQNRVAIAVVALTAALAALAPAAAHARAYHSPGYKGKRHAPKTRPAPAPKPLSLGTGAKPQVTVDAGGTAHIVWTESRGDAADVLHYCRLKRGATRCDAEHELVPSAPGDGRESPLFNNEVGTPRVLALGDQVALITNRYPNPVITPKGNVEERNTFLFVSNDGGDTVSPGVLVGKNEDTGVPTVFGPPGSPRIGLISDTETFGPYFQEISGARYETRQADLGDDGVSSSLAPTGDTVMAAFDDLHSRIHLRRWSGSGDIHDQATWSESTLAGDEPLLAGGPAGMFLISRQATGRDRRYDVRTVAPDGTTGVPAALPDTKDAHLRDLFEDPSGGLRATYVSADSEGREQLFMRASADGRRWPSAQLLRRLPAGQSLLHSDIAAAFDGGGFAVAQEGSAGAEGRIVAVAVGNQGPTGRPGLGNEPGGHADPSIVDTCQRLEFAAVDVVVSEGCLLGAKHGVKVSEGTLRLNGLEIVPEGKSKIVLDPHERTIDTTGAVRVQLRAAGIPPVVLYRGPLHIGLRNEAKASTARAQAAAAGGCTGKRLADFGGSPKLLGFPIKGGVSVFLGPDSSCIPVSLALPPAFGGIRGEAVLRATNQRGLIVDSLKIDVDRAFVGPLLIENLEISYASSGDVWHGHAKLGVPPQPGGLRLEGDVVFKRGRFKQGSITVTPPYPGVPLGPFPAYLASVGGGFGIDPVFVEARAKIGLLQAPPTYVFAVKGKLRVTFGNPVRFELHGDGLLFDFPLEHIDFLMSTSGFARLKAGFEVDLVVASASVDVSAFVDVPSGSFSAEGSGHGCVAGVCIAGADVVVSSKGLSVCVDGLVDHGAGYHWGDPITAVDIDLLGCDLSSYVVEPPAGAAAAPAARAAAGERSFTVARGAKIVNLRLSGAGGAQPRVALVAPSGRRIEPTTKLEQAGAAAYAAHPRGGRTTFIGIKDPQPGTWQVVPAAGSPAITQLAEAHDVPVPKVKGRVLRGRGRKRTLAYRASTGHGLRTTFVETGRGVARKLGVARGKRGRLRFSPAPGPGGKRRIEAIVERGGIPRLRKTIARYKAPRPARPARVKHLSVSRRGGALRVRWRRARGASVYAVRLDLPDGRRVLRVTRRTRLGVRGVPRRGRVAVRVRGRNREGHAGPAARGSTRDAARHQRRHHGHGRRKGHRRRNGRGRRH